MADADEHPVDLSLVLPHYRARNQPTGHRMSMFVHSRGELKSMIVSAVNYPTLVPLSLLCSAANPLALPSSCVCIRRAPPL